MAIFNTNMVDEEVEMFDENGDILDSMLEACENMLDAIDGVDEAAAGGARGKYVKMIADKADAKQDSLEHNLDKHKSGALSFPSYADQAKKDAKELRNLENRAHDASLGYTLNRQKEYWPSDAAKNKNIEMRSVPNRDSDALRKEKWMNDHGNKGEDKLANKKPGTYAKLQAEKKRAIKETCLYILDILDEI